MNSNHKQFKAKLESLNAKLKNSWTSNKMLWIVIIVSGVFSLLWEYKNQPVNSTVNTALEVDTLIPYGYTLVPIEIENYEALDSVFGNYGVVDLYTANKDVDRPPKLIGKRLKMLRAPLNPTQFAVLVKDEESTRFAGHIGPVFVVVHNRSSKPASSRATSKTPLKKFQIIEEDEI